jgi:hypothetical protein
VDKKDLVLGKIITDTNPYPDTGRKSRKPKGPRKPRHGVVKHIGESVLLQAPGGKITWWTKPEFLVPFMHERTPGEALPTLNGLLTLLRDNGAKVELQASPDYLSITEEAVRDLTGLIPEDGQIYVDHEDAKKQPKGFRGRVVFPAEFLSQVQAITRVSYTEDNQRRGSWPRAIEHWFIKEALQFGIKLGRGWSEDNSEENNDVE